MCRMHRQPTGSYSKQLDALLHDIYSEDVIQTAMREHGLQGIDMLVKGIRPGTKKRRQAYKLMFLWQASSAHDYVDDARINQMTLEELNASNDTIRRYLQGES